MMILTKVLYEIFESDVESLETHLDSHVHEIDRQIRLVFQDETPDVFISWQQSGALFNIAFSESPFFLPPTPFVRDMSASPIWSDLIGRAISLQHLDEGKQILQISYGQHDVFCCSREDEQWDSDVLQITTKKPRIDGQSF